MRFPDELARLDLDVSRETLARLDHYAALLKKWSPTINLVGKATLDDVLTRHIVDSAQLFRFRASETRLWCDLGAGGGLPGVVIAAIAAELAPGMTVTMIEADQRKAAFLLVCLQELSLKGRVLCERIERAGPQSADTVSARALAPLKRMLPWIARHVAKAGVALLPKGQSAMEEVEAARQHWIFDLSTHRSVTSDEASILALRNIRPIAKGEAE